MTKDIQVFRIYVNLLALLSSPSYVRRVKD